MITRLSKLKNFGLFKHFQGLSIKPFSDFNLIYGWNYSGKTTLSRAFRCLEKKQLHADYQSASFEFDGSDGKYDQTFLRSPNIRVYNFDFVRENLKWDSDSIEPIFLLGEENIELQNSLVKERENFGKLEDEVAKKKEELGQRQQKLSSSVTNKAREIGTLLGIRPFDARHLNPIIDTIPQDYVLLTPEEFAAAKQKALSTEQKEPIAPLQFATEDLATLEVKIAAVLRRKVLQLGKISYLLEHPEVNSWVETGKSLHENKTHCEFCGNPLPEDLLERLNKHFSTEYDTLKNEVKSEIFTLESKTISYRESLPAKSSFYAEQATQYDAAVATLDKGIDLYNATIRKYQEYLESKLLNLFDTVEIEKGISSDELKKIACCQEDISGLVAKNNLQTKEFGTQKANSINAVKLDMAANLVRVEGLVKEKLTIARLLGEIDDLEKKSLKIQDTISELQAKLDETVKGAEKVNHYLRLFFEKSDIDIRPTPEKKFALYRDSEIAKNLSEGEKTAIAFAYFVAKLEEQKNNLSETVVYIDDPVSSLDSNHLFNIYSLIKSMFYSFKKDPISGKGLHLLKCKQLFLSTHNLDFHNLIFDWFKEKSVGKNRQSFYIVDRVKNQTKDESVLKDNSGLLTIFNSEYAYLFSIIHEFSENPTVSNDFLYHLPNIMRRFVESYLCFRFLSPSRIDENIDRLFSDPIVCERARKYMHYFSHSLNTDRTAKFPELAESQYVVGALIRALGDVDPEHLQSLQEAVTNL